MIRHRGRRSFARREMRAQQLGRFLKRNWGGLLAVTVVLAVVLLVEHLLVEGWLEGFVDGLAVAGMLGFVGLIFLLSGPVMQLGGIWGESLTRDELKAARKRGHVWGSVDNIELDRMDIDHVLDAPSGVRRGDQVAVRGSR